MLRRWHARGPAQPFETANGVPWYREVDLGPPPDDDARAIERVLAGDREAFGTLVARYGRRVHDLARRMLKDAVEAEDVAQQAFLNAFRALPRYDARRPFSHWLLRITSNLCRNRFEERRRRPLSFTALSPGDDEGAAPAALDPAAPPLPPAASDDDRLETERVRAAVSSLGEPYRLAVVLRYTQGLSLEDISEITGVPVATVKTHLHRARAALARLLLPTPGAATETRPPAAGTPRRSAP
jgi:RNA polymerase sigma-70 factor, ECF subfamily